MPATRRFLLLTLLISTSLASSAWAAPKFKVLRSFGSGTDGAGLWSSLVFDAHGNLYGTTSGGGEHNTGIVFELSPQADGRWQETILYNFCSEGGSNCTDGKAPFGGPIVDSVGNVYGTTQIGGTDDYGVIYELSQQNAVWTETVLYSFTTNSDGGAPTARLTMDPSRNLYGTGGDWAFELSRAEGEWILTGLHEFGGQGDGAGPAGGVIRDAAGNLYGTTELGGGSRNCGDGCGTAYRLHPTSTGSWKETILHSFQAGSDGAGPGVGALALDGAGNLYGTTGGGGTGYGTVFRLSPGSNGRWKETVLYDIPGGAKGNHPSAGVVVDKAGSLFGTTIAGGSGCGVVYKLAPQAKGKWKYTVLHAFTGYDGCEPDANLILDSKGNLYGTTVQGGTYGVGVAFELTP